MEPNSKQLTFFLVKNLTADILGKQKVFVKLNFNCFVCRSGNFSEQYLKIKKVVQL